MSAVIKGQAGQPIQFEKPPVVDNKGVLQPTWGAGTVDISSMDSGILTITPDMGRYVTLTGHGTDDYIIEGFGDQCPVGWLVTLVIPRTIGDTGGSANSLGNYVQFIHSVNGSGFDNEKIKIMVEGVAFRGYRAYPDKADSSGFTAALSEEVTYQHVGAGRWVLREIPTPVFFNRSGTGFVGELEITMDAMGRQNIDMLRASDSTVPITVTYPSRFNGDLPIVTGNVATTGSRVLVFSSPSVNQVTAQRFNTITGDAVGLNFYFKASGRWKPIV